MCACSGCDTDVQRGVPTRQLNDLSEASLEYRAYQAIVGVDALQARPEDESQGLAFARGVGRRCAALSFLLR